METFIYHTDCPKEELITYGYIDSDGCFLESKKELHQDNEIMAKILGQAGSLYSPSCLIEFACKAAISMGLIDKNDWDTEFTS